VLRKTAPLAIALVIVFICIPAFADTVTYSSANSGTYTYEYTWTWTTEPGGFSTEFWIAVHPDVESSGIFQMSTESNWTYQGVSNVGASPTGKALLWTGSTMGAKTHTFKVGSNVYGPAAAPARRPGSLMRRHPKRAPYCYLPAAWLPLWAGASGVGTITKSSKRTESFASRLLGKLGRLGRPGSRSDTTKRTRFTSERHYGMHAPNGESLGGPIINLRRKEGYWCIHCQSAATVSLLSSSSS